MSMSTEFLLLMYIISRGKPTDRGPLLALSECPRYVVGRRCSSTTYLQRIQCTFLTIFCQSASSTTKKVLTGFNENGQV